MYGLLPSHRPERRHRKIKSFSNIPHSEATRLRFFLFPVCDFGLGVLDLFGN